MNSAAATEGLNRRSGAWAAILAFFLPVDGFAYVRRIGLGLLFAVLPTLLMWVSGHSGLVQSLPGFYLLLGSLVLLQVTVLVVAFQLARRTPAAAPPRWYNRWFHYAWLALASVLVMNVLLFNLIIANRGAVFGYESYRLPSSSMEPTLKVGDFIVVDMRASATAALHRGDIVTYTPHRNPDQTWIARIVGLPGEEIDASGSNIAIDGRPLQEPYLRVAGTASGSTPPFAMVKLGNDEYFLVGDNRPRSDDSRYQGPYPRSALRGRARHIWFSYPPDTGIDISPHWCDPRIDT